MQFFFVYCGGIVQLVTSSVIREYRLIRNCVCRGGNYLGKGELWQRHLLAWQTYNFLCVITAVQSHNPEKKSILVFFGWCDECNSSLNKPLKFGAACFWPWHWNESENFEFFCSFALFKPTCLQYICPCCRRKNKNRLNHMWNLNTQFFMFFNCLLFLFRFIYFFFEKY